MGTWDTGIFDNDAACDWVCDLEEAEEDNFLDRTLDAAIRGEMVRYPTYAEHSALAAAEIIAALLGRPCGALTETAEEWLANNPRPPSPELVEKALVAIDKVAADSPLAKSIRFEKSKKAAWEACIEDLKARLK